MHCPIQRARKRRCEGASARGKRQLDENENLSSRLCNQHGQDFLWNRLRIYKRQRRREGRGKQIESDSLTTLTRVGINGELITVKFIIYGSIKGDKNDYVIGARRPLSLWRRNENFRPLCAGRVKSFLFSRIVEP
jgi:hypothetical protein